MIPSTTLKVYEKNRVDIAIEHFIDIESPSLTDIDRVRVQADIQEKLDVYRFKALGMSEIERETEKHSSERMARLMTQSGDPRPASAEHCHCHAIVSGAHNESAVIRAVLAWAMMRIDDPRNGCWLPKNSKSKPHMPSWLRNAVPHSRIHRNSYYRWLSDLINPMQIRNSDDLIRTLRMVRMRLQSGSLPKHILVEMRLV